MKKIMFTNIRKIESIEEKKAFYKMPKLEVYDNFFPLLCYKPEEENKVHRLDNIIVGTGYDEYDIFELPNGYFMTIKKYDGTISIYRKIKTFNSFDEIKDLVEGRCYLDCYLIIDGVSNDGKEFYLNNRQLNLPIKVTLPITENDLNKIFKKEFDKFYAMEKN